LQVRSDRHDCAVAHVDVAGGLNADLRIHRNNGRALDQQFLLLERFGHRGGNRRGSAGEGGDGSGRPGGQ
jgi:hypothetical protein